MNSLTKSDWDEIQSRINNRICPYCGGNSKIELDFHWNTYSDIVVHKTISCCCDDYNKIIHKIINEEYNNQIQKKINEILNM